jgi:hypothetical protein
VQVTNWAAFCFSGEGFTELLVPLSIRLFNRALSTALPMEREM